MSVRNAAFVFASTVASGWVRRASVAVAALLVSAWCGLCAPPAHAVTYYWDTNGSAPGAASVGNTAPGTWGVDTFWTTSITGVTVPSVIMPNSADVLIFSAGSDATGTYTVNLSGTGVAHRIYVEEGDVTLNGAISVTPPAPVVNSPATSGIGAAPGRTLTVTGQTQINGNFGFDLNAGTEIHLQGGIHGAFNASNSGNSNNRGTIFIGASNYNTLVDLPYGVAVVATGLGALGNNLATTIFPSAATLGFDGGIDYSQAKAVQVIGDGYMARGAIRNYSGDNRFAGNVTFSGSSSIVVASDSLELYGGISSAGVTVLTKNGAGTLLLTGNDTRAGASSVVVNEGTLVYGGTNTFTGAVTVGGGGQTSRANLNVNFGLAGAPVNNILNSTPLSLNGGEVRLIGSASAANSQQFGALTLLANGASKMIATSNGHNLVGAFTTLTRQAGSTLDFTLPGGAQSASNGFTFTTAAMSNGILHYATVGETNWAYRDGVTGNILSYTGYGVDNFAGGAATNVDVSAGAHAPGVFTVNSLRFNGASTLTLNSANKSQLSSGAILVTPNGNVAINGVGAAALAHVSSNGEFLAHNYGVLNMNAPIANGAASTASPAVFAGTGTTYLNAANTFGGSLSVTAGTVELSNLGSLATSSVVVANGATFDFLGAAPTSTIITNNGTVNLGGARTISRIAGAAASAEINLNGTLTLDNQTAAASYIGTIHGAGGIVKQGAFAQTLSPQTSNTFTGGIHIQEGSIIIGAPSGDVGNPRTPTISISPDGFIVEQGAELNYSLGGNRFWIDDVTLRGGKLRDSQSTNNTHVGNILLEEDSIIEKNAANFTITGSITGPGGFEKTGVATLTLASTSISYEGPTTVSEGTMTVNSTSSLGDTSALIVQNLNTGAGTAVTLNLNKVDQTVGSLSGSIATPLSGVNTATLNLLGTNNTLTIKQTVDGTFQGVITGAATAKLHLHDDSNAALTLTGANTFGGGVTIDGGTLLVSNTTGSGTGTGNVIVNAGGTLGGTGVIAGTVFVNNGGALAPGASAGALTINGAGGVSFGASAAFQVEIGGLTPGSLHDQLIVLNGALLAGELQVSLIDGFFPDLDDEIVILTAASVVGTFSNAPLEGSRIIMDWGSFAVRYLGNQVTLFDFEPAPIPEPSSFVLLGLGLLAVARRRRAARA